jgi:hypothetical protein
MPTQHSKPLPYHILARSHGAFVEGPVGEPQEIQQTAALLTQLPQKLKMEVIEATIAICRRKQHVHFQGFQAFQEEGLAQLLTVQLWDQID